MRLRPSRLRRERHIARDRRYEAVLVSMESTIPFRGDIGKTEDDVLYGRRSAAERRLPLELQPAPFPTAPPGGRVSCALKTWAEAAPRPLVVFLDEIDSLANEMLISVLGQICAGHADRPRGTTKSRRIWC